MNSFLIILFGLSSSLCAQGSILLYNYSFNKVRVVVLTQTAEQAQSSEYSYPAALFNPAPMNENGSLQTHPVDANYVQGSNIPIGSVGNVEFDDLAKYFYLQILNDEGVKIAQIQLDTFDDNDPDRVVYVYAHMNAEGQYVPNAGGSIFLWSKNYPTNNPSITPFYATAVENGL